MNLVNNFIYFDCQDYKGDILIFHVKLRFLNSDNSKYLNKGRRLIIVTIIAKSGVGKDTLIKEVRKRGYKVIISYTTRKIRSNEINGVEYIFVDKDWFKQKELEGFFAEIAEFDDEFYGVAKEDCYKDAFIIVEENGLEQFINVFGKENVFVVYMTVPEEIAIERMRKRGDSEEKIQKRVLSDRKRPEIKADYIIDNSGTIEELYKKIDDLFVYLIESNKLK